MSDTKTEDDVETTDDEEVEALFVGVRDIDIADLSERHHRGEHGPVILAGYWVLLGTGDNVPERYHGHLAAIVESPWAAAYLGQETALPGYTYERNGTYTVRTRDEADALLTDLDEDDFIAISPDRVTLTNHA